MLHRHLSESVLVQMVNVHDTDVERRTNLKNLRQRLGAAGLATEDDEVRLLFPQHRLQFANPPKSTHATDGVCRLVRDNAHHRERQVWMLRKLTQQAVDALVGANEQ